MFFIQSGAILGNSNVYIFLDINHAITRGLHRPGSRGGGAFQNMHHGKQPYNILGIIRRRFLCVFQKSSLANHYIVEYIIPTEKYIANTNTFMSKWRIQRGAEGTFGPSKIHKKRKSALISLFFIFSG